MTSLKKGHTGRVQAHQTRKSLVIGSFCAEWWRCGCHPFCSMPCCWLPSTATKCRVRYRARAHSPREFASAASTTETAAVVWAKERCWHWRWPSAHPGASCLRSANDAMRSDWHGTIGTWWTSLQALCRDGPSAPTASAKHSICVVHVASVQGRWSSVTSVQGSWVETLWPWMMVKKHGHSFHTSLTYSSLHHCTKLAISFLLRN